MTSRHYLGLVLVLLVVTGCVGPQAREAGVVKKYAELKDLSDAKRWGLIGDTEKFWADIQVLYAASLLGNREAFRTFLLINSYTDGAVAECMPDFELVLDWHPEMCRAVIFGDERLRTRYGRRLAEWEYWNGYGLPMPESEWREQ